MTKTYNIIIAALGADVRDGETIMVNRDSITTERLEANLRDYWAWNIGDKFGADGPAIMIEWLTR